MINQTLIIEELSKLTIEKDILNYISYNIYILPIAAYWLFQFILTMIIGYIFVKEDKSKFFAIFIFTQLIGAILLFFTFIYPVLPPLINGLFS